MTPRLIHPVLVTVQPIDRVGTEQNALVREPVKIVKRAATLSLLGQVQWGKRQDPEAGRGGTTRHDAGYAIFLVSGLTAAGWTPTQGDRIVGAGQLSDLALYVTGFEPCMTYDGVNKGLVVNFSDKRPARA